MYVSTFYSFKGGVGRTLALVNVAVELAGRGRRVLLVDFDLEAPGLDTFDLGRPPLPTPGVIDFVSAYLRSGRAPDVTPFVFESTGMGDADGSLWIMPAGAHHDGYANTLSGIDWGELYDLSNDPHELTNLWDDPDSARIRESLLIRLVHAFQNHADTSPYPLSVS